jgi:hypothetical protein
LIVTRLAAAILGPGALLVACAAPLPTYEPMDAHQAWDIVARRIASLQTVQAEADATLSGPEGSSLRLDAAVILQAPSSVRFRAWKLGNAVLDLTGTGEGVWFDAPPAPEGSSEMSLGVGPRDLASGLRLLGGWEYAADEPTHAELVGDAYIFECRTPSGAIRCEVDGRTLLPRRLSQAGDDDPRFDMELTRYRVVDGLPWPGRVVMRAGERSIVLDFRDVALNEPGPGGAFTPAPSAERVK